MAQDKFSPNDIPNLNVDWGKDTNDSLQRPYSGRAVQKLIKEELSNRVGYRYEDTSNDRYLFFSDEDACNKYLSDPDAYSYLVKWSEAMQKAYTAELNLTSGSIVSIPKGKTDNYIEYTFDVKNKQGASAGDDAVVTYQISNSGTSKTITEVYPYGKQVKFCVDDYLTDGTNRIQINFRGRQTLAATTQVITYNVVALSFDTEFDITKAYAPGSVMSFNVLTKGSGVKYFKTYIDGTAYIDDDDNIVAIDGSKIKTLTLPSTIASGKHNLRVVAYITNGTEEWYTAVRSYDFAVTGGTDALVLFQTEFAEITSQKINATQYLTSNIKFALYDPKNRNLQVQFKDGTSIIASKTVSNGTVETLAYTPEVSGTRTITATVDGKSYQLGVEVAVSSANISKATNGMLLELSAKGRSNNDSDRATWMSGSYTGTLQNVPFTNKCGWSNDALVLSGSARLSVNINPLEVDAAQTGLTIELDYMVENGNSDDDAVLLDLWNQNRGIKVTPTYVEVQSKDGRGFRHLTMTGKRKKMAIIINRSAVDANKTIFMTVVDGKIGYSMNYDVSQPFICSKNIVIGNDTCVTHVYGMRVYNRALSVEEAFGNWAIDSGNVVSIANRNDIFVEGTNRLSFDKTKLKVNSMKIIGNIDTLLAVQDKTTTINATVIYYDPQNINNCWIAVGVVIKNQGTSTLKFPVKNFSFNFTNATFYDALEVKKENTGIKLRSNSCPVKKLVAKCDYMESSSSFNTRGAISFNDTGKNTEIDGEFKLLTNAQKYAKENNITSDIRTAIDGVGIAMFWQKGTAGEKDGKLVIEGTSDEYCLGQYNLNNGKDDCPTVYGFSGLEGFDSSKTERWELAEEGRLCKFTRSEVDQFYNKVTTFNEVTQQNETYILWTKCFEPVWGATAPDNLYTLCNWLADCENDQTKFDNEYTQHLDPYKVAHYYLHIFVKNLGVDQVAKNMHLMTEDQVHWFPIYYDGDSAKLNDNDGFQYDRVFAEGVDVGSALYTDRQSKDKNGNYYFQCHDSVLWNRVEGSTSFMAIIRKVAAAEYSVGFCYGEEVKNFITDHTAKFPERIINENANAKYFDIFKKGGDNYLYVCQGDKEERVKLIADRRLKRYEAMWGYGGYTSRTINFRLINGNTFSTEKVTVKAYALYWFAYSSNLNMVKSGVELQPNGTHGFAVGAGHQEGDILRIHGTDQMSEIDFSEIVEGLKSLEVGNSYSEESSTHLKKLVVGNASKSNGTLTQITGLSALTELEYLDIQNLSGITSIGQLNSLKTLLAKGSSIATFNAVNGNNYDSLSLPTTIADLVFRNNTITTFDYTPTSTLGKVSIQNTTGIDTKEFVFDWLDAMNEEQIQAADLTLDNINWSCTLEEIEQLAQIGTKDLRGVITLDGDIDADSYNAIIAAFGQNAFNPQSVFYIICGSKVIIGADHTTVNSGKSITLTGASFPNSETAVKFHLYQADGTLVEESNGTATYNGLTLNCNTGAITTTIVTTGYTVKVMAYTEEAESELLILTINKTVEPTAIVVSGAESIQQVGDVAYTVTATPSDATVPIESLQITVTEI